jgi:MFS family permease
MTLALAICNCPIGGLLSNWIGRRKCFMTYAVIGTIGWVGIALSPNVPALFVGRFLTSISASGLVASIGNNSFPPYIALFHYVSVAIYVFLSLSLSPSFTLSPSLTLCPSVPLSFCPSVPLSLCPFQPFSPPLSISLYMLTLSPFLSSSLSPSLSLFSFYPFLMLIIIFLSRMPNSSLGFFSSRRSHFRNSSLQRSRKPGRIPVFVL